MEGFSAAIWPGLVLFAWLFIAIGLMGCGGPDGEEDPWCDTHRCEWVDLAFDPDPELASAAERAAARLDTATGEGFTLDAYGVPVQAVPQAFDADGVETCGSAEVVRREGRPGVLSIAILVATEPSFGLKLCMSTEAVIMHEAIHAFSLESRHVTAGLFSANGSIDEKLNGSSLDELCKIGCWSRHDER